MIEIFWQLGHCKVDLYWPYIKSTIIDWFLSKCYFHSSSAFWSSLNPIKSGISTYGLCFILFKSSWRPSKRKLSNSAESCCAKPENIGWYSPITFLKLHGETTLDSSYHMLLSRWAYWRASFPPVPRVLSSFNSSQKCSSKKYFVRWIVFETH